MTTHNPRLYSFLIAWNDNDASEGDFGWSGEAGDRDAALEAAYNKMSASLPKGDGEFDLKTFSAGRRVIEEWHGTDPWAEPSDEPVAPAVVPADILAALKAGRDALAEALTTHIYDADNGEEPEPDCGYVATIAQMDAAIADHEEEAAEQELRLDEASDRLRLVDWIADKIGLPKEEELSDYNFAAWLASHTAIPADVAAALRNASAAISSMGGQLGPLRGMFGDGDGAVEDAVEAGDQSVGEIEAVLAAYAVGPAPTTGAPALLHGLQQIAKDNPVYAKGHFAKKRIADARALVAKAGAA